MRLWLVGLVLVGACASLPPAPPNPPLPQISDSAVRVQVDPQRGGGISFLEILDGTRSSGNIVDQGDLTGRGIQLALYHGASLPLPNADFDPAAWPCRDNAALWGHDPVLMGNACQQLSGCSIISQAATSISVQSTPLEWNSARGRSHVDVTASTEILSAGVVQLTAG